MTSGLNPEQTQAAGAEGGMVVAAGAGSGKTTVLTRRYLRLILEEKAEVESILTLTFTKKAAAEMNQRIHGLLTEHRRFKAAERALARFDRARISTLDSFCAEAARQDCGRFGIPKDFGVMESGEESRDLLESAALNFILSRLRRPGMIRLCREYGLALAQEEIFLYLGQTACRLIDPWDFPSLAKTQIAQTASRLWEELRNITGMIDQLLNSPSQGKFHQQLAALVPMGLSRWDSPDSPGREALAELLNPIKNLPLRGFPQGEEGAEDKNLVRRLRAGIETALGLAAVAGDRDFLLEAAALAGEFQDEINQTKRLGKTLSFQDVAELAVEVLKTNLSVRRFYKNRIKYIMIDEFQDNNRLQKELLYLLAEKTSAETPGVPGPEDLNPDKLYFVGDEKQSIYRFRGADVSVFKGLSKELSSCGGRTLSLRTNYRSEPDLIAFFNPLFSRVLSSPEEAEDFEAAFEPLAPRREEGEKLVPRIELWYFPLPDNDGEEEENPEPEDLLDPQETEAFELARFIRRTVEEKSLPVRKDGKIRPAAYEDFALLLRSNTSQFSYERWFRRLGVPFEVENPCSFFLEAVVNDITAFLRLLLDPQDLFALTTFLRSPLVNLPDDSLSLLLLQNLPDPLGPEGWELMPRESDRNKLRQAWEMRQELLALADRVPHRELIDRIWHEWGYRYFILQDPSYHNYLDFFDYFFALAQGADQQGLSLAAFVDRLIPRLGRAEKAPDLKIMKPPRSGVRIMTIHASKGLEFPVVILANAGNEGRQQNAGSSSCYFSPSLGISFRLNPPGDKAGNPIYNEIRDEEDTRQKAELKRLFYVALTRAESHLIVAGHHNRNKNYFKADSSLDPQTSLLNLFLLGLDFKFGAGIKPENAEVLRPYLKLLSPLPVREAESLSLPVKRRNPAEILAWAKAAPSPEFSLPRRQRGVLDFLRESSPPGLGESGGQRVPLPDPEMDSLIAANHWETLFGSLCHLLLEEALSSDPRPGREKEKEELLSDLGAEDSRALTQAAERLCQGFLKTPLGAKLKGGLEKYCEFDFLLRKEEGAGGLPLFLHGRIDFLARCGKDGPEGETEWIVADFKAGAEKEGSLAFAQLALYREAVGEMFPGYGVRCFVCYLRDGSAEELK